MFKFPLEKLIKIKKEEERIRIRYLNEVMSKINTLNSEVGKIRRAVENSRMSLHEKLTQNRYESNFGGMQAIFEKNMTGIIRQKDEELTKLFEVEKICRQQYEEIYTKRKSLENLKSKRYQEYLDKKKKQENLFYDEVVISRSFKNLKNDTLSH